MKSIFEGACYVLAKPENRIEGLDLVPVKTLRDDINKDNGGAISMRLRSNH